MAAVLRVTQRCILDDLGLTASSASLSIDDLADQNAVVAAFRDKRSAAPNGQETIQQLVSHVVVYSLHAGEARGATWYDKKVGIVWLLAARFHRSGKKDDAYPYFRELDAAGHLLPTRDDYQAFFESQALSLAQCLVDEIPPLRKAAQEDPGAIKEATLGSRIRVRVVYEEAKPPMMTVAISQRLLPGELQVPADWQLTVAAGFLPYTTPPENLSFAGDLAGQALRDDEVAYCDFVSAT